MPVLAPSCPDTKSAPSSSVYAEMFDAEQANIMVCDARNGDLLYINAAACATLQAQSDLTIPLGYMMGEALAQFRIPSAYNATHSNWGVHKLSLEAYPLFVGKAVGVVLFRWELNWQNAILMRAVANLENCLRDINETVSDAETQGPQYFYTAISAKQKTASSRKALMPQPRCHPRMKGSGPAAFRFHTD